MGAEFNVPFFAEARSIASNSVSLKRPNACLEIGPGVMRLGRAGMGITWLSRANSQFRATWLMLASARGQYRRRHVRSAFVPMLPTLRRRPDARGKYATSATIELTAGFEHAICFRRSSEQAVVDLIAASGTPALAR